MDNGNRTSGWHSGRSGELNFTSRCSEPEVPSTPKPKKSAYDVVMDIFIILFLISGFFGS